MKLFKIRKGSKILLKVDGNDWSPKAFESSTNHDQMEFMLEDLRIDPLHVNKNDLISLQWGKSGYYGFRLPKNELGYDAVLVHSSYVEIL